MNTNEAINEFILHLTAQGRSAKTIVGYQYRLLIIPDRPLAEISPQMLDAAINTLRARELSSATINGVIQAARTFFSWCVAMEYIGKSPARFLHRRRDRDRKPHAMRQVDLLAMLDYCAEHGRVMDTAIILLLADSGCRVGELCSINMADLDLDRCSAVCRGKRGERDLDYTERTADALRAWINFRPAGEALFANERGRLTIHTVYNHLRQIGRHVGAVRYNPHSIRHRVGQGWIDAGVNLEVVRLKLGHRDITTTAQIYGNQDRERIRSATRKYSLVAER